MIWRYRRTLSQRWLVWSLLSLAGGAALWFSGSGYNQGFALLAALCGLIEGVIALMGLRGLKGKLNGPFDAALAEKDSAALRKLLWISAAAGLATAAGGLTLALTLGSRNAFTQGSGWGIAAQGAFGLVFSLLHALGVPREITIPDGGLFTSSLHDEFHSAGEKGMVILVHGFPGTPIEMRALGEAIQQAGWGVHVLLLPGFGKQIPSLFQQRAALWSDYIAAALQAAQAHTKKVILVSFSMGAGLSIPASVQTSPTALVLVSPFWLNLNPLSSSLIGLVGLLMPESINPFKFIPPRGIESMAEFSPPPGDLYPTAPELMAAMGEAHLPMIFIEQFALLSQAVKHSAKQLTCPLLVLQGDHDRIVRPAMTRKLVRMIGPKTLYKEIPGEHHIVMPDNPAFGRVCAEVIAFINQFD
jgi:carboxylesterase